MEKLLGKISKVSFGVHGSKLGLHLSFSMSGVGADTSKAVWDFTEVTHTKHSRWTESERNADALCMLQLISKTLSEAKVSAVSDLLNVPVEVVVEDGMLKSWRILTEVL